MKKMVGLIFSVVLFASAGALPAEKVPFCYSQDYGFEQNRMVIDGGEIFVLSSFDTQDHVTAYTIYGSLLWNAPFHAKILSWEVFDGHLFVFSKDRLGQSTYLTCIDRQTGKMVWQRP